MLDRITNRSRGFGFVTFDTKEDMEECIAKLHGTELDGRKISVTKAIPQSDIAPGAPASAIHGGSRGGRERCGKSHIGCVHMADFVDVLLSKRLSGQVLACQARLTKHAGMLHDVQYCK
jgi:hypothetical protein